MSIKLLTYDVYRSGMTLFKDLADLTYQDREHLPVYYMRAVKSGLPEGVDARYCVTYRVAGDPHEHMSGDYLDVIGSSGGGIIQAYIVGETPYASDWLGAEAGGTPLTPTPEFLYLILTPGNMFNCFVRYIANQDKYVDVIEASGDGAVFSYTVVGKTPLDSDWLTDVPGGSVPMTPKEGLLYLVCTAGRYQNRLYKYNATTEKYELVSERGSGVIFAYEVSGKTPFASDWLSETSGGSSLTPYDDLLYLDMSPGKFNNFIFRYDATANKYLPIAGGGSGVVFSKEVSGKTPFNSDWLEEADGTTIVPDPDLLYLDTAGKYKDFIFSYNATTTKYVPVSCGGYGVTFVKEVSGKTPFNSDWFADQNNEAITPISEMLYLDTTVGKYENYIFRYNPTTTKYVPISGSGSGVIFVKEVSGKIPLNADWLIEVDNTVITPDPEMLYLDTTVGKYENFIFRYNSTTTKYVPIAGSGSGVIFSKEVSGKTPFASDWLVEIDNTAIVPDPEMLYLDTTVGKYENYIFRYNSTLTQYVPVSGGGGNGAIVSYIVGSTAFASDWLSETVGGDPLTPEEGPLYLVLTSGQHYSAFYRYDETNQVYILVSNARVIDITKAEYLNLPVAKQNDGTIYFITDSATSTPGKDDYIPARVTIPENPSEGSVMLWKGAVTSIFDISPAFYKYNGTTWIRDNLGIEGQTIQVDEIPVAMANLNGTVIQYIGASANGYVHNFFYECMNVSGTYKWVNTKVQPGDDLQFTTMPTATSSLVGKVYQYIGTTNANYTHNYFYECVNDGGTYKWENVKVQPGEKLQFTTMPTASAELVGSVFQYTGTTDSTYTHNFIYECVNDNGTYKWVNTKVQPEEKLQYTSMPAASASLVGKVYQYIGTTGGGYTHNFIYECVKSGSNYVWRQTNVQNSRQIKNNGTAVTHRETVNFTDFDITDDSGNSETDVKAHKLTSAELHDIVFPLPVRPSTTVTNPPVHYSTKRWLRFDPTNKKGVIIKAGTQIMLSTGVYYPFTSDTKFDLSSSLTTPGKDYFLFMNDASNVSAVLDKAQGTGVYIGRLHTLCANAGTLTMKVPASPSSGITMGSNFLVKQYDEETDPDFYAFYNKSVTAVSAGTPYDVITTQHPLSGFLAGDILPESIICDSWKPNTKYEDAMVYDANTGLFVDVYLQSGTGNNTKSVYNATITVTRQQPNCLRDMLSVGKRLLFNHEFFSIALGSNECTEIGTDSTTTGGHTDTGSRRMISAIGCEDCCGLRWQWLLDIAPVGGIEWGGYDGRNAFGKTYGTIPYGLLAGGGKGETDCCGPGALNGALLKSDVPYPWTARGARFCE